MKDKSRPGRQPAAFPVEPPKQQETKVKPRPPAAFDTGFVLADEAEDPFLRPLETELEPPKPRKRFPFLSIFLSGLGILVSAALALWIDELIRTLFARADWLGYAAIAVAALCLLGLFGMVARELVGLRRLASVQALKDEAEKAAADRRPEHARQVVERLSAMVANLPETAKGRAILEKTREDIIDASGLLSLAEIELLGPADRKARMLVLSAAKRVSIVTAVSPRAIMDLGYVLFESSRLIRAVAETYGTRPGRIGMLKLFRDVIAHLAVTGSIAVGDGIAQQVLGHGVASKISARLGEGVINGLMTVRIGIAAMDLLRPLPFKAVKRPGVGDFMSDLAGSDGSRV